MLRIEMLPAPSMHLQDPSGWTDHQFMDVCRISTTYYLRAANHQKKDSEMRKKNNNEDTEKFLWLLC